MPEFIHLHNHSHYSLLDGASTIDGLVQATIQNEMPAVALTDHGVMFGAIEFYKAAKKAGIKPIIGCEVYIVTKGSRFDKEVNVQSMKEGKGRGIYHHLVLLAKNLIGYKNLMKLVSIGHTEGFYYKPRIDLEVLQKLAVEAANRMSKINGLYNLVMTDLRKRPEYSLVVDKGRAALYGLDVRKKIGRASCRERVCQYV